MPENYLAMFSTPTKEDAVKIIAKSAMASRDIFVQITKMEGVT